MLLLRKVHFWGVLIILFFSSYKVKGIREVYIYVWSIFIKTMGLVLAGSLSPNYT
ncbi:hypothetical protein QBC44DRAFT_316552 [Cladorrhinum sp. PSN332]|nr:hypothetical protein QBC44DRAFT_316552 [Cladorrhinum sp. PSN332]